ncbi:hypothetical protein ACR77J_07795 [Tissierella praeacuta]
MVEKCLSCRNYDICNRVEVLCNNLSVLEEYEEDLEMLEMHMRCMKE